MTTMVAPPGVGQLDVAGGALAAGIYNAVGRGIDVRVVADLESDPFATEAVKQLGPYKPKKR